MNILVFGKDGQLGKAFQDLFCASPISNEANIRFIGRAECDLSNVKALSSMLIDTKPDLIINTSAYTAVDKAESDIDQAYAVNAQAPGCMAEYAVQSGATLLHYSTDYVFDGNKAGFYVETDQRNPLGIYGKSKAAGELAIEEAFVNARQGQYAIFRTSWVYGAGSNFIRTILRLAKEREELRVIEDQYGVPTSAAWLARVSLDLALDTEFSIRSFNSGVYHAVPNGKTNWHRLACLAVQRALDAGVALKASPSAIKPILAVEYPLPAPRPMNSLLETSKLKSELSKQLADGYRSYNYSKDTLFFPEWDAMVQEYVAKLAAEGLI